ncbi:MAG: hypothetical protein KatS3mg051_0768 [Anaerolineae bacterium]|nr:MAG: hypothetical protein KatS3mg051_0768 [Anaerolineae bacterium]
MFGTSDLLVMTPGEFDHYMREIVDRTIEAGVIPILSTFPGNMGFWDRTILYNQIVVRIALDYDIPLINLWLALESLPNHGLEPDGFHLGEPPYGTSCYLTAPLSVGGLHHAQPGDHADPGRRVARGDVLRPFENLTPRPLSIQRG